MRRLVFPARLDALEERKHLGGFEGRDWSVADIRKYKRLETLLLVLERARRQGIGLQLEPFPGERLEGVREGSALGSALSARIAAGSHNAPGIEQTLTRQFEWHIGISTEGDQLLSTLELVSEAPPARTAGMY